MDHGERRMTAYEETTGMIMPRVSSVISHRFWLAKIEKVSVADFTWF